MKTRALGIVLAVLGCAAAGLGYVGFYRGQVVATQPSPDGRFRLEQVVVWNIPPRLFAMPGDGGWWYSHGYIRLRDAHGSKLAEAYADQVGSLDRVVWTSSQVRFIYFDADLQSAEWPLSR